MSFICGLISVLSLLFIGIVATLLSVNTISAGILAIIITDYMASGIWQQSTVFLAGILLIFTSLGTVQKALRLRNKEKMISFDGAEGKISITLTAIEDLVKKMLDRKEIPHARPKITVDKKGITMNIDISLHARTNIPEFARGLQSDIKEKMVKVMGDDKNICVKIKVKRIITKDKETPEPGENSDDESREIPFRNY